MRKFVLVLTGLVSVVLPLFSADAGYKQPLVLAGTNTVRVRLPLTDVTGKVRVKERTANGFGLPVAPSKTRLGAQHYLEWQIGYDTPGTNSPTAVPQIHFIRNGQIKYGHELSKIIFDSVRLGLLSTNDLTGELKRLKSISPSEFEESRAVQVEFSTNAAADGFQSAEQHLPQFTKTTPQGAVQIQLKQKQRAVGYQAMVYVCLPLTNVLAMDGSPRPPGKAQSKETVYYEFNRDNAAFLLDIVHAFGLASSTHNRDIRDILEMIAETANGQPAQFDAERAAK